MSFLPMIYKITLLFFILLCFNWLSAQNKDSIHRFSVKQCLEYGLEHQPNNINSRYEVDKASDLVREYRGLGLPQVNGFVNIQDYLELPTTLIPAQFFGGPAGDFVPLQFGTQFNTTAEVDASQIVFDGTYIVGLEAAQTYKELSRKSVTQTDIQTVSQVTKAYYTVLINNWKAQMLDADTRRLKALMDETEALYKSGFSEKTDWERVKVNYNNVNTQELSLDRLETLSFKLLKFQMGMPMADSLILTDNLTNISITPFADADTSFNPENRIEYVISQIQLRENELLLKKDKYAYLPGLSLYGSINRLAYGEKLDIFSSSQSWYPTAWVGLRLNVPIFSGLQKLYKIHEDKITILENENTVRMLKQSILLDVSSSFTNLENALADLKNQHENMELAQNLEHDTKIKYESGTGSNLEVIDAETSLTEAETNYYNALFNSLTAKVDYEQAKGVLYK